MQIRTYNFLKTKSFNNSILNASAAKAAFTVAHANMNVNHSKYHANVNVTIQNTQMDISTFTQF